MLAAWGVAVLVAAVQLSLASALRLPLTPEEPPASNGPLKLLDALDQLSLKNPDGQTCLAISGPFMGRLSNTVSMMNMGVALSVAAKRHYNANIQFKYPQSYTAWMKKERLDEIFGHEPVCANPAVRVYNATCPANSTNGSSRNITSITSWTVGRCSVYEMLVDPVSPTSLGSSYCDCSSLVLVPSDSMNWDHHYEWTHEALSRRYWQSHSQKVPIPGKLLAFEPGAFPRQVVMHVRLGDIEKNCSARFTAYNCNKKLKVESYLQTMQALMSVLSPRCLELGIVTDGRHNSPDIEELVGNLSSSGLKAVKIWTPTDLGAASSFHLMTHSDILVFGSSGFGQLAAVLARAETARIGNPMPHGHQAAPLFYKANTSQMRVGDDGAFNLAENVRSIEANPAIQALAADCQQRLRRN